MKLATKLMIVPFTEPYTSNLDIEMNKILKMKLSDTEKLKLYNILLIKYRENYEDNIQPKLNDVINEIKNNNIENMNNVLKNLKTETDVIDDEIKKQYNNINDKIDDLKIKKKRKSKKNNIKTEEQSMNDNDIAKILDTFSINTPKNKSKSNKRESFLPINTTYLENENDLTYADNESEDENPLNQAMNRTKPLTTRATENQYNKLKSEALKKTNSFKTYRLSKSNEFDDSSINDDENISGNGLKRKKKNKISWTSKKYFK